jgi:hypothetical protein
MKYQFLNLPDWNQISPAQRTELAQELSENIPGFQFTDIQLCELGEKKNFVAFFNWKNIEFALIPGAEVTLGYDRDNPFIPNEAQLEEWEYTREEYGCELNELLNECMTPLRKVAIKPFLIQVTATEFKQDRERNELLKQITQEGFRFPTSDEWEYACSAGVRTIFRWGNDCALDCYPIDSKCKWDIHRQRNAFGLHIASNPYNYEFCAEANIIRGGDGGCAICGGYGFFSGWLTLASAFVEPYDESQDLFCNHVRRAYSLFE